MYAHYGSKEYKWSLPDWPWRVYCKIRGHSPFVEMDDITIVCSTCFRVLDSITPQQVTYWGQNQKTKG
jgi:hypothetical protein